jgi:hypothetical protein
MPPKRRRPTARPDISAQQISQALAIYDGQTCIGHLMPRPRGPLDGLVVRVDRPCRCGSLQAVIVDAAKGPHVALLRCTGCDRFQQRMSRTAREFLLKFVAEFGRPTEPVRLFENVNPAQRSAD